MPMPNSLHRTRQRKVIVPSAPILRKRVTVGRPQTSTLWGAERDASEGRGDVGAMCWGMGKRIRKEDSNKEFQSGERAPFFHLQVGMISSSTSRDHSDHSSWTAVIGWTACARRMVAALASDRPKYFTFPSSTSFFISPTCTQILISNCFKNDSLPNESRWLETRCRFTLSVPYSYFYWRKYHCLLLFPFLIARKCMASIFP